MAEKKQEAKPVKLEKVTHNSLSESIAALMEDVDYIKRKGKMTGVGSGYSFATAEQIVSEVRASAIRHGLRISIGYSDAMELPAGETKNGSAMYRVRVKGSITLVHGKESEAYSFYGEGADTGDKATSKAQTSCLKQGLRQIFLIETGEDDPDKATPEGKESFEDIMKALPDEITDAFAWLKLRKFSDMSKPSFRNAVLQIIEANERDAERIKGYLADHGWKGNVIASDMAMEKMPG